MAIARSVRPTVLIAGNVERTRELRRKKDQTIYGHEIVVKQREGALVGYTIYLNDEAPVRIPSPLEFVVAECSVEESRDFGTSLNWESNGADTLDFIVSTLSTARKAS